MLRRTGNHPVLVLPPTNSGEDLGSTSTSREAMRPAGLVLTQCVKVEPDQINRIMRQVRRGSNIDGDDPGRSYCGDDLDDQGMMMMTMKKLVKKATEV
ncbi:hypothetical protein F3Y22_tig00111372pilonHSYRG00039 [Hibiscus syriacus]|uniref:Uncharacterized protein n=1 Tax=Hibiscus syriacus TaxID=106335 RepID=A0A6A2YMV9_HIBSY|nr:hypothetical protein F3Y22_tig00111372pilonHSYRG00039 [Hibiscus syriacus]